MRSIGYTQFVNRWAQRQIDLERPESLARLRQVYGRNASRRHAVICRPMASSADGGGWLIRTTNLESTQTSIIRARMRVSPRLSLRCRRWNGWTVPTSSAGRESSLAGGPVCGRAGSRDHPTAANWSRLCRNLISRKLTPSYDARSGDELLTTNGNVMVRTGLPRWRRSAYRTRLQTNSLLTGNFTGKLATFMARRRDLPVESSAPQPFPT
jgi:hypothetical protein